METGRTATVAVAALAALGGLVLGAAVMFAAIEARDDGATEVEGRVDEPTAGSAANPIDPLDLAPLTIEQLELVLRAAELNGAVSDLQLVAARGDGSNGDTFGFSALNGRFKSAWETPELLLRMLLPLLEGAPLLETADVQVGDADELSASAIVVYGGPAGPARLRLAVTKLGDGNNETLYEVTLLVTSESTQATLVRP